MFLATGVAWFRHGLRFTLIPAYAGTLSREAFFVKEVELTTNPESYEYSGILHAHSKHSDGSGTVKSIIKAAQKVDLDYIIITDHNTLQAMEDGAQGWHDDLLVMVGEEITASDNGHYLALGISNVVDPEDYPQDVLQHIIEAVRRQGGIGFAPHPLGLDNSSFDLHLPIWDAWDNPDYTGLEIWSYMRDWAVGLTRFNVFRRYFRPDKAIHGPSPDLLRKWDQLCQKRRVVGIGGADAHARRAFPFNFIKFLSYERTFRGVRTHLLTSSPLDPDLDESKNLVFYALGCGHCFFAHDALADSTGFSFTASTDEGRILLMGDEARLGSRAELEVISPVSAVLRLIKDGRQIEEVEGERLTWETDEPGVYRVEAQYDHRPWVFTNPIYLRESISPLVY